jgi:hypothetical protein
MADENMTPETEVKTPTPAAGEDLMPRSEAENLLKALKAEREARKQYERDLKETKNQLERFAEINPDEYTKLQNTLPRLKRPPRRLQPPRLPLLTTRRSTPLRRCSMPLVAARTLPMACRSST